MSSPQKAYSRCHKGLTLFSDEPHPRVWFTFHYRNPSRRIPEPFTTFLGHTPTTQLWAPKSCRSFTTRRLRGTSKRLGYTMHPRGTSSWEHNAPKSNKLFNDQLHVSPWREQPNTTNAKGKSTSAQILHSQISPKATSACGGGEERKN